MPTHRKNLMYWARRWVESCGMPDEAMSDDEIITAIDDHCYSGGWDAFVLAGEWDASDLSSYSNKAETTT